MSLLPDAVASQTRRVLPRDDHYQGDHQSRMLLAEILIPGLFPAKDSTSMYETHHLQQISRFLPTQGTAQISQHVPRETNAEMCSQ